MPIISDMDPLWHSRPQPVRDQLANHPFNGLIARAITDSEFKRLLLSGDRAKVTKALERTDPMTGKSFKDVLDVREYNLVISHQESNMQEFACLLVDWYEKNK